MLNHYYARDYLLHLAAITGSKLQSFSIDGFLINFFVKEGPFGKVINSSPFYGSHGGLHSYDKSTTISCETVSMGELVDWLTEENVSSVTIVENPYSTEIEISKNKELIDIMKSKQGASYDIIKRFSSVKRTDSVKDADELMASYHSKTRNCLRKYLKSGARIRSYDMDSPAFNEVSAWLAGQHKAGIEAKNGVAKPFSYFQDLKQYYLGDRVEIKLSYLEDEPIAGLLNFKARHQIEYWTPVVTDLGKVNNAIYGLIHNTLEDIIGKRDGLLNFGGSWYNQNDLQRFKLRFGSNVREYSYHCFVLNEVIFKTPAEDLLQSYPYFFIKKFS